MGFDLSTASSSRPPRAPRCRGSRATIVELAEELGLPAQEREIWPRALSTADPAFATGSAAGVVPVAAVDGGALASARDPLPTRLARAYRDRKRDPRYLVPVRAARAVT